MICAKRSLFSRLSIKLKYQELLSGVRRDLKPLSRMENLYNKVSLKAYAERIAESDKAAILDSLVHMHCNRLLGIDPTAEKRARAIPHYLFKQKALLE